MASRKGAGVECDGPVLDRSTSHWHSGPYQPPRGPITLRQRMHHVISSGGLLGSRRRFTRSIPTNVGRGDVLGTPRDHLSLISVELQSYDVLSPYPSPDKQGLLPLLPIAVEHRKV